MSTSSVEPERATWPDMIREYQRPTAEKARLIEADLRPQMEALVNLAWTLAGHTETGDQP